MRRRRLPPAHKEMPARLRVFDLDEWADPSDVELPGEFRVTAAHGRWTAARVEWWRANGVDFVDVFREAAEAKLARLRDSADR